LVQREILRLNGKGEDVHGETWSVIHVMDGAIGESVPKVTRYEVVEM